ncbi:MAG TPA: Ig-like domain-containing protein [Burkholderiales bacterium]|jgi:hypothetical protein|nr:Ig-like domain-containing protein [Burkholderiales bacterium]
MRAYKAGIALAVITLCTACGGGGGGGSSSPSPAPPPSASIVSPPSGQTISGVLDYWVSANPGVTKVDFSVSSASPRFLGTSTAAPFGGSLDTTTLENGSHTLTAVATDAQGRTSTSQVAFTVQNGGGGTQPGDAARPASLLFWSGFESGVSVGAPRDCYTSGCWQDLVGTDSTTGFSWGSRIAGLPATGFQVRAGTNSAPSASTITNYIVNDIQTVTGPTGATTRALYSLMKQTSCTGTASQNPAPDCAAQDPYLLQPTAEPGDMYISFWRKLDPTLTQKLVNGWHMVFEWKTTGDYRISAQLVNYGQTNPYWELRADNVANGGLAYQEFWRTQNRTAPAPVGQWFKFEVFWHRSAGSEGRVWMAANGQTLIDKFGPNIGVNGNPIERIFLTQLYTAATYPIEQWTDDVQIWSAFPTAKAGDPWYDGVYGPH